MPSWNVFDRAVERYDPVRAVERARARTQMDAYHALRGASAAAEGPKPGSDGGPWPSLGRGDGWMARFRPRAASAAADLLPYAGTLRGQSRQLVRSEPYAASAIGQKVQRAVGTGLTLSAQPRRDILGWSEEQTREFKALLQAEFSLFADSTECDLYRTHDFYDNQPVALRAVLESGDAFTVLPDGEPTATQPYALRVQILEADRVGNPLGRMDTQEWAGGIRRDARGAPVAAYVYDHHPGTHYAGLRMPFTGSEIEFVGKSGRRKLLHHFAMLRPEQPRGVPDLAPVMGLFKLAGDWKDATLKAAIAQSFLAILLESEAGNSAPVFGLQNPDPNDPTAAQATPQAIEVGPAAVIGLARGEKPHFVDPTQPNAVFGAFMQCVIDELGAGTQLGPELVARKYNTSYVAARAAFLDAWQHLRGWRRLIARGYCQPIYETWFAEAVILGRIKAPGFFKDPLLRWAYTRAVWNGDSQGSINPKDEVKAYADAIDARLCSRERAEFELFGTDFSETYDTKKAEHERLKRDDMLPVPKAGAAAPAPEPEDNTTRSP